MFANIRENMSYQLSFMKTKELDNKTHPSEFNNMENQMD